MIFEKKLSKTDIYSLFVLTSDFILKCNINIQSFSNTAFITLFKAKGEYSLPGSRPLNPPQKNSRKWTASANIGKRIDNCVWYQATIFTNLRRILLK